MDAVLQVDFMSLNKQIPATADLENSRFVILGSSGGSDVSAIKAPVYASGSVGRDSAQLLIED